jgi:hypothetical protein
MAESWLRLSEHNGRNIQAHDTLLLYHELFEIDLLIRNNEWLPNTAHTEAEKVYNYASACREYYTEELRKYKNRKRGI